MSSEIDQAFQSLFFGDGAIVGFMVVLLITIIVVMKGKELGIFMIIPHLLLAFQYLDNATDTNGLFWYAIGTFFLLLMSAIFTIWGRVRHYND